MTNSPLTQNNQTGIQKKWTSSFETIHLIVLILPRAISISLDYRHIWEVSKNDKEEVTENAEHSVETQ